MMPVFSPSFAFDWPHLLQRCIGPIHIFPSRVAPVDNTEKLMTSHTPLEQGLVSVCQVYQQRWIFSWSLHRRVHVLIVQQSSFENSYSSLHAVSRYHPRSLHNLYCLVAGPPQNGQDWSNHYLALQCRPAPNVPAQFRE